MVKKKEASFEGDLARLEEVVAKLEAGPPTLDETLALFEEGVALAKRLQDQLAAAETRVQKLLRDADGGLVAADDDGR
jgi:exodeoxyribonuclease VII small subunit